MTTIHALQSRWKVEGRILRYYGLRSGRNLLKNKVSLTSRQLAIVQTLPRALSGDELRAMGPLLGVQVVPEGDVRPVPTSLDQATFCAGCCANDFIIPGLEFDENGLCPLCQTKEETAALRSVVPLVASIPRSRRSRFDVALFITGGKDSVFLLHHLANVQKLRVLALTWEIPFMSRNARASLENARARFPNVEFLSRKVSDDDLRAIYRKLYQLAGNTCACPSLAYILFYPTLVEERVPCFIVGNEPAQMAGLYYNGLAPRFAYTFGTGRLLTALVNVLRVLTLHPPLRRGQLHTLMTMRQLAYGDAWVKTAAGYGNALVSNVVEAIHQVPSIVEPLKRAIRRSSWTGHVPAFVQMDLAALGSGQGASGGHGDENGNGSSGGEDQVYDWDATKATILKECGWVPPDAGFKGLHTSCSIEKCKEHTQFLRFYRCESPLIPLSALEISLACRDGSVSREKAIQEMRTGMGFTLDPLPECQIMTGYLGGQANGQESGQASGQVSGHLGDQVDGRGNGHPDRRQVQPQERDAAEEGAAP